MQQYCQNSKSAYLRWTNPETETLEQFRSDYPPVSFEQETIIIPPEFEGGQCPNVVYRFHYQRANISNGTFSSWSDFFLNLPAKISSDAPFSRLKLFVNGQEVFYREDGYLFHWSFNSNGVSPFGRTKSYQVTVDTQNQQNAQLLSTSTFGVRLMGFVAVNGQINCPEDESEGDVSCNFIISDSRGQVFSRTFPNVCPSVELICEEDSCPEATCAVDCGDHVCCYDSRGIAIKIINK